MATSANEVEASFYRYLEDLAQPWLDPHTLATADRDILFDLLLRCQQAEHQLGRRSWLRALPSWATPLLVCASVFAIMLLYTGQSLVLLSTVLDRARDWLDVLFVRIIRSTDLERLLVVGLALIAVSIYAVSRTARS
jgi:hypothetical protein